MATKGSLDAERRREGLVELLRSTGSLSIDEVVRTWQVHPMTIRRDLRVLREHGLARLVRGGAVHVGPTRFARRRALAVAAKQRIAEKAQALLPCGAAVGADASTTLHAVLSGLVAEDLLVVTYGLENFELLDSTAGVRAYLTGGERDGRTGSLVGPVAVRSLTGFSLVRCFLSATGVDPALGCSEPTAEEAEMKQAMVQASAHVVLAVDSSKLGQRSYVRSVELERVDMLLTELPPEDPRLDPYRDVVEVR